MPTYGTADVKPKRFANMFSLTRPSEKIGSTRIIVTNEVNLRFNATVNNRQARRAAKRAASR